MTLELQIVSGRRVLFRAPIQGFREEGDRLSLELDEDEIRRLASVHSIVANEGRLRVMLEMMRRGGEVQFSDLLDVAENPKLVSDCMKPLVEEGMVAHGRWGSSYRTTTTGTAFVVAMTAGLTRMLEFLDEQEDKELE